MLRLPAIVVLLALLPGAPHADTAPAEACPPPPQVALWKGFNIGPGHSAAEFRKLAAWGTTVLRLTMRADPARSNDRLVDPVTQLIDASGLAVLDTQVRHARAAGLKVIIDLHTFPGNADGRIWEDAGYHALFVENWARIAQHYAGDDTVIGYDLMNEPNLVLTLPPLTRVVTRARMHAGLWHMPASWRNTPRDYFRLMQDTASTINAIDPGKAIVIGGMGFWGAAENFRWMEPLQACNVVYSFHLYHPFRFTHSGRKDIPASNRYVRERDLPEIMQSADVMSEVAARHGVPVWVGEFGVSFHSENRGGPEWLDDVLTLVEARGWGWAYWTYSIPFRSLELGEDGKPASSDTRRLAALRAHLQPSKAAAPSAAGQPLDDR